jgi:hypothetical protein
MNFFDETHHNDRTCPVCAHGVTRATRDGKQRCCVLCMTVDSVERFGERTEEFCYTPPECAAKALGLGETLNSVTVEYRDPPEVVANARSIDDGHAAFNHLPPQEIQDALTLIERFFASRGAKQWAFGSIQSRNADSIMENALRGASLEGMFAAPTITREQLAIYAGAFRMVCIPRATQATVETLATNLCDKMGCTWAFADALEKMRYRDTVIELLTELGVY